MRRATGIFFTVSILEVMNNFMKNLYIAKSNDFNWFWVNGQTSRQYSRTGRHLPLTSCNTTFSEDMRYMILAAEIIFSG